MQTQAKINKCKTVQGSLKAKQLLSLRFNIIFNQSMKSPRPQQLHVGVPCFLARNLLFVGRMMSAARVFFSKCSCCSFVCLFMTHNWFRLLVSPRQTITNFNTSYRNIVGRSMLRAFGHHFAMRCGILRYAWCCWLKFKNGQIFHATLFCRCCTML